MINRDQMNGAIAINTCCNIKYSLLKQMETVAGRGCINTCVCVRRLTSAIDRLISQKHGEAQAHWGCELTGSHMVPCSVRAEQPQFGEMG